jgi:hypothetical protein
MADSEPSPLTLAEFKSPYISAAEVGAKLLEDIVAWGVGVDKSAIEEASGAALQHVRSTECAAMTYFDKKALLSVYEDDARYGAFRSACKAYFKAELLAFKPWFLGQPRDRQKPHDFKRLLDELKAAHKSFMGRVYTARNRECSVSCFFFQSETRCARCTLQVAWRR